MWFRPYFGWKKRIIIYKKTQFNETVIHLHISRVDLWKWGQRIILNIRRVTQFERCFGRNNIVMRWNRSSGWSQIAKKKVDFTQKNQFQSKRRKRKCPSLYRKQNHVRVQSKIRLHFDIGSGNFSVQRAFFNAFPSLLWGLMKCFSNLNEVKLILWVQWMKINFPKRKKNKNLKFFFVYFLANSNK